MSARLHIALCASLVPDAFASGCPRPVVKSNDSRRFQWRRCFAVTLTHPLRETAEAEQRTGTRRSASGFAPSVPLASSLARGTTAGTSRDAHAQVRADSDINLAKQR
jgi:hypothetical protein